MNIIYSVNAHYRAFFTTSIAPLDGQFSLYDLAQSISSNCLAQLNLLGEKIWGGTTPFLYKNHHAIPSAKQSSPSPSLQDYIFAGIFFVPHTIVGALIRVTLLVVSPIFRHQYKCMASYFLSKKSICIEQINGDSFRDPIKLLAKDLSLKDVANLSRVNKTWYNRAKLILAEMAKTYHIKNSDLSLTTQQIYNFVQANCASNIIDALGMEHVLALPIVHFKMRDFLPSLYQELKKHRAVRTLDCQTIAILTESKDNYACGIKGSGVLFFRSSVTSSGRKIAVAWSKDLDAAKRPEYYFIGAVDGSIISELVKRKTVT